MNQINRYYESGDSLIKVLNVIDSDKGSLFVCLNYSTNHNCFDLRTFTEQEFKEWYEANEINDGDELMPTAKADNLL